MKLFRVRLILLLILSVISVPLVFAASDYRLDWWSVDGGGESSSGGGNTVAGSAGQPDAGEMYGGGYALSGGVWQAIPTATPTTTPTMTPTATATVLPSVTATVSPSPTPVPTVNVGGPSSKSVYLPLIMNGAP